MRVSLMSRWSLLCLCLLALPALAQAQGSSNIEQFFDTFTADWVRRDPDLASLHGEPEFEKLYPAPKEEG